jgi:hypothetical protein
MLRLVALGCLVLAMASGLASETDSDPAGDRQQDNMPPPAPRIETTGLKLSCFYPRDVNNWVALNREYFIVYAPNKNRPFLVQIAPQSIELRNTSTIGFAGRDRICGKAGEYLVVEGGIGRRYTIMNVWQLDKASAAQMVDNKKKRTKGTLPAPMDSPGAEPEAIIQPNRDTIDAAPDSD